LVLAFGIAAVAAQVRGADAAPPDASTMDLLAAKLPPDVGDAARKWLHEDSKEVKAALAFSPKSLESEIVTDLASEPDAAAFVLSKLPVETPETVTKVLKVVAFDEFWVDVPGVAATFQSLAEQASDPDLMLAYLDTGRRLEDKRLRRLITARIADARKAGDEKTLQELAAADERWLMEERGAAFPGYLRRPPQVFPVMPADKPIRIVGFGDFGSGNEAQRDVAAAIVQMGKAKPFDFGVTFGDNFYPKGMTSTEDPRWRDWWETLYGPLGITFYPSLGNHEWYSDDGAIAEISYRSPTWRFPSPYYTHTAGQVQFFVVDTTEISEAQAIWLDRETAASNARWKVVYGHHPIFAPERNGKAGAYMTYMQARLWPIIRGRVDAYLCGHQHAMAHMSPREGVHFFMSGGGGAELGKVSKRTPGALFAESRFGFLTLEGDEAKLSIAIFDTDGKPFDSEVITK
jgi:hypothetical protein